MRLLKIAFLPLVALLVVLSATSAPASPQESKQASAEFSKEQRRILDWRSQEQNRVSRAVARKNEELAKIRAAKIAAANKARQAKLARERAAAKAAKARKAVQTKYVVRHVSSSGNRSIGKSLAASRGWTGQQWACLEALWTRESGWRTTAANPSGAYGIPQALPGSKMSSAGADWRTNPATQIRWGLGYISGRYGTPCGAWSHFQSRGWY